MAVTMVYLTTSSSRWRLASPANDDDNATNLKALMAAQCAAELSNKDLHAAVPTHVSRMWYKIYVEISRLWGATSPQHQRDCRADDVTMVHNSAEMRYSITLPQFNLTE